MSQMFEDFKKYRDRYGLNQLHTDGEQGGVEDNGALFTMEYLICMLSNLHDEDGKARHDVFKEIQQEIQRLRMVFATLEEKPGISVRYPGNSGPDSMDNAGALLAWSALWGDHAYALRRQAHGLAVQCDGVNESQDPEKNRSWSKWAKLWSTLQLASFFKAKNFWNVTETTKFNFFGWHGRSPGMMGWLDICATGRTTRFRSLGLWVGQMLSVFAKKGDTDAWKLAYVIWYSLKYRGKLWRWGYDLWVKSLLKKYPGGMQEVYSLYYQDENHPIRLYSKPYIV